MPEQVGRGYPIFPATDSRKVTPGTPVAEDIYGVPELPGIPGGGINVNFNGGGGGNNLPTYTTKNPRRFDLALDNTFETRIGVKGTFIHFAGQNGGTAGPIEIRFGDDGPYIPFTYDRAYSGIPFNGVWVRNNVTQAGITATLVFFDDSPVDRVEVR